MTKKEQREKKIKDILKKVLNVFCYVVTALAIVLGIAMGVNKCSGSAATQAVAADSTELREQPSNSLIGRKNSVEAEDYNFYISRYSGSQVVDLDNIRSYFSVSNSISPYRRDTIWRNFNVDALVAYNNSFTEVSGLTFRFIDYPVSSTSNQYEYKLNSVYFNFDGWIYLYNRTNEYATGDETGTFNAYRIVLTKENSKTEELPWTTFLMPLDKSSFVFNEAFNYNAPFNVDVGAVYGSTTFTGGGDQLKYKDYSVGWFFSNGRIFDTIRWWAMNTQGVAVEIDGSITTMTTSSYYIYTFMYYRNSISSEEVMVNARDNRPYSNGNSRYYANSSTWIVPAYRKITFLTELSPSVMDSIEAFNNNNQSSYSGGMVSGEVNDVFSLVAGAFTAWLPVLSMYILPNITIGTLLFVPLVALLVFAIIRIIKK